MPLVSATDVPIQPYPTGRTSPQAPDVYERIPTSPSMFGALQAEALQQAGQQGEKLATEIGKIGAYQQVLHNRIVTDQQTSSFEDKVNKVMYGDPEVPGDVGYMGLRGQAALDQRAPTRAKIDQILQEHRQALQNVHQQLAFNDAIRGRLYYAGIDIGRHYDAEYTRWGTEVTHGRADTALGNAGIAANNADDNAWQVAFSTGRNSLAEGLTLLGHPPEYVTAEVAKYDEKAATDYAKKLAVRSPWLADKFVDANRQYLPNTYDDLKKGFKVEADKILKDHIANGTPLPEGTPYQIQGGAPATLGRRGAASPELRNSKAAQLLGPYAVDNAVVGGPSGVEGLNPEFAQRIDDMAKAMPDNIRQKFTIISGYRSDERQAQVNPAVKNSRHTSEGPGTAYAVDTTNDPAVIDWINKNGKRFGVDYTLRHLPNEQNHLEMVGPGGERMTSAMTRAYNVGNIRRGETGFQSYGSQEAGVRAISDQLDRYAAGGFTTAMNPDGGPINTVRKIISTWSPPNENNTSVLIDQAAKVTGFGPDQVLNMNDPATRAKVVEAIIRQEQGGLPSAVTRDLIRRAVASGAPPPAPTRAATTTAPAIGNEIAVGDSIAAHLIRKAGVAGKEDATTVANRRPGDTAVSGLGPNAIRDEVIPNMSDDDIRGKHVILSSGVTNKPGEIAAVAQQIQALRNRGATDITLLGVGNDPRLSGVNDKLAEIAAANNAAFAGPMRKVAGDKIHSDDNQDLLAQVRGAQRPTQPDTPGAPPSTTTAASGEPAPVRVAPLAGAAAPAAPGQPALPEPDRLLRDLPEPEEGVLPDTELGAAYRKRIEEAAKRVPPGTSQQVWHGAVSQIRREMSWQLQLQRRETQIAEQQAKAAMHQAENEIYRDVYSANPKITPQQIATDPRFDIDPTRRRQMLELVNNPPGSGVPPAQSWAAAQSLIERIRLPEGDPNKITDTGQIYDSMRLLNKPDFEFAMKQFNDIKAPGGQTLSKLRDDFVKRYSGFITKSNPMAGVVDAVGEARLYEFERYIDQQVDDYKKAGKDPTALFTDTGSPTFLGHESVIRRFQPTPEQSRQAIGGMAGGSVTPLPPVNRPEPPPAPPPPPIPAQRLPGGGVEVPLPPPLPATNDNDAARRPDESPDQYIRRRGL